MGTDKYYPLSILRSLQTRTPESNSVSLLGAGSLTGNDAGAVSDKPGSVSECGSSAASSSSSREFNFGSATGALASISTATATGSNKGAVASATLATARYLEASIASKVLIS